MSELSDVEEHVQLGSDDDSENGSLNESTDASHNPSPISSDDEGVNNEGNPQNIEPNWRETYDPIDVDPFIENTGPTHNLDAHATEIDYFKLFFNNAMIQNIVDETNRYATQHGPDSNWSPTNHEEISAFIGMQIFMGIVKVPDYSFYWSGNKYIGNQGFKDIMPVKRYEKLNQYIHVNNAETDVQQGQPGHDKLHKLRPLIDASSRNFSDGYRPKQNQSVDEAMVAYKGRYSAKQYIPSKPIKWGFKVWMRCDSKTGYCHQYDIYMGKETGVDNGKGLGHRVVEKLTQDLHNKNHHVYFDSFFTSVPLVQDLLAHGVYSCGTIRQNRKGFPQDLRTGNIPRLQAGQFIGRQTEDLVSVVWMDNRAVSVLASNESLTEVDTTTRRQKDGTNVRVTRPRVITNYQEHFRGVDICDQLRTKYDVGRPSKKWWKYLMNFIIDLSIINAFLVMTDGPADVVRPRKRYRQLDFRVTLASQLIGNFSRRVALLPTVRPRSTHLHVKLGRKRSTCKLCTKVGEKKRKTTQFGCDRCNTHLCSLTCYNTYHTNIGINVDNVVEE